MSVKTWARWAAAWALTVSAGCAPLLVGAGALGGYAISQDSVRNQFDMSQERLYARSLEVAKQMGFVTAEDARHGTIEVKIQDTNVKITVTQLTKKSVELKVKARNTLLMPEINIAQSVYNKIIEKL